MHQLLSISPQGLGTIFSHFSENDYKVVWIRNPDYSRQIYLSPSYQTVWQRSCESLYDNPCTWEKYLVGDGTNAFVQLLKARRPYESEYPNKNNTVLYRILDPAGNINWIKDSHFFLFDSGGHQVAVAGIAEAISETQWRLEMEKNCSFEEDRTLHFQDSFISILEKEMKLTAQLTPHAILLDDAKSTCHILTVDNQKIKLTRREVECISQLCKGMTAKQIAHQLAISPRTIETYINRIKEKTHCRNCLELVGKIKGFAV